MFIHPPTQHPPPKHPPHQPPIFCVNFSHNTNAGLSGDRFHFDVNGDGPARYNIIHFKQSSAGVYGWVKVGEYYEGELRLNMDGKFARKMRDFQCARRSKYLWMTLIWERVYIILSFVFLFVASVSVALSSVCILD